MISCGSRKIMFIFSWSHYVLGNSDFRRAILQFWKKEEQALNNVYINM